MIEVLFEECEAANLRAGLGKVNREETSISHMGFVDFQEIICLELHLDKGLLKNGIDDVMREQYIQDIYTLNYSYQKYVKKAVLLEKKAREKTSLRIWLSNVSYSQCGLYYICNMMQKYDLNIYVMCLPPYIEKYGNMFSWGQLEPDIIDKLLINERKLSNSEVKFYSEQWKKMVQCRLGQRLLVNGNIIDVPENFFDEIILNCVNVNTSVKNIIQEISMNYPVCMDDYYILYRIKQLIKNGAIKILKDKENIWNMLLTK